MIFQGIFIINSTITNFVKVISEGLDRFFLQYMDTNYIFTNYIYIQLYTFSDIFNFYFFNKNLQICRIQSNLLSNEDMHFLYIRYIYYIHVRLIPSI